MPRGCLSLLRTLTGERGNIWCAENTPVRDNGSSAGAALSASGDPSLSAPPVLRGEFARRFGWMTPGGLLLLLLLLSPVTPGARGGKPLRAMGRNFEAPLLSANEPPDEAKSIWSLLLLRSCGRRGKRDLPGTGSVPCWALTPVLASPPTMAVRRR